MAHAPRAAAGNGTEYASMGRLHARAARAAAAGALTPAVATGCGSSTTTATTTLSGATGTPVTVGISLPLSGDFAADGLASEQGYQLWASDANAHGGLLGRPIQLVIRDDKSDPKITASDYQTLIATDHVDLTLAPFSSLLTEAAIPVTTRNNYALIAGSAGAPAVFASKSRDFFSTTVPVQAELEPFVDWIRTLPAAQRPKTAAYPMVADPFADPPVQTAQQQLSALGITTVYQKVISNPSAGALSAAARAVAALNPDMVVIGSVDVPTVAAFINTMAAQKVNPKVVIAAAGPDQGQAFIKQVGTGNTTGVMVPNAWYGALPNALSHLMVQDYIAKFGGTASDINADVAEAYSAGEVLAAAVTGTGGLSQGAIIDWLHANPVDTDTGPAKFDGIGENVNARQSALIFQWQPGGSFVQVLPATTAGSVHALFPKPNWGG
jgi:branched-chain amino acid transport system substrate-binding protein